jgi:hypothetical protein
MLISACVIEFCSTAHLSSTIKAWRGMKVVIGKIVKSYSHIDYACQIYGPLEVEVPPGPSDYAFGHYVRVAIHSRHPDETRVRQVTDFSGNHNPSRYMVGVIYDTMLLNPTFGSLGPRLSNEAQVELFSPDYLLERAVLVHVIMLGTIEQCRLSSDISETRIIHGVPTASLELNSSVETMTDEEIYLFHLFRDQEDAENQTEYLHMGYLPHMITQQNSLLPLVILNMIDQLEQLFPQQRSLLSILKRNFAWRIKVETTG